MTTYAPVAFFTFSRLRQTQLTMDALAANVGARNTVIYIFCDGLKPDASDELRSKVNAVRAYLKSEIIDKNIFAQTILIERDDNYGLSKSIIEGVTNVVNEHGKVIVLEDDIVTSPFFLTYMNDALTFYKDEKSILSINSCNFFANDDATRDTFFSVMADCWGWATWADRWALFEKDGQKLMNQLSEKGLMKAFNLEGAYNYKRMLQQQIEGRVSSWAVRWLAVSILNKKLNLYPNPALSNHIAGEGATHANESVTPPLAQNPILIKYIPFEIDASAHQKMRKAYNKQHGLLSRIKLFIENLV